ncbi:toll/interleukin-1 receptor domain-containing protein [Sphaerisporangium sp. B11E5]|uniref:toll/interleukin-1 receptor domain-containing protein n=1 Tax=Sphaerisporangium sp. B11E5 TaxID=3153563 RepID=UPI00325E3D8D
MDMAGFALTLIGTLAGIAGAYFAWVPLRGQISRRRAGRTAVPASLPAADQAGDVNHDVFVSYSHDDASLVRDLVEHLGCRGVGVVLDEVVMRPGVPLVHAVEQAIRDAAHGLLVFSKASVASGWVTNEYYVLMQRAIETGQLFIPVLIDDVPLPEFARTRYYSDLRDRTGETLGRRADEIAEALRAAEHRSRMGAQ